MQKRFILLTFKCQNMIRNIDGNQIAHEHLKVFQTIQVKFK